jgi:hypothetical protein
MSVTLTGDKKLRQVLDDMGEAGQTAVAEFVTDSAIETHRAAVRGIQRGPASGRMYRKYNPSRLHQASAPGEYPMSDRGRLASSVQLEPVVSIKKPVARVGTALMYGRYLEFKNEYLGGRPWLSRAIAEMRAGAEQRLKRLFRKHGDL